MTVCTACSTESPDDLQHCPQCGAALPEPDAPGNTSHFGEKDLEKLMSRMGREAEGAPPPSNLMAGLPRPKVGSMASPLRGGQTSPSARRKPEQRARSASGSTVMGMPLFTTGEQRAVSVPARQPSRSPAAAPVGEAPVSGGPSIHSLDSFQDDFGAEGPRPSPEAPADPGGISDGLAGEPAAIDPAVPEHAADPGITGSGSAAEAAPSVDGASASRDPSRPPATAEAPADPPITSPDRPTEPAPAVESSGAGRLVAVILIAAALAGVAFFLLK